MQKNTGEGILNYHVGEKHSRGKQKKISSSKLLVEDCPRDDPLPHTPLQCVPVQLELQELKFTNLCSLFHVARVRQPAESVYKGKECGREGREDSHLLHPLAGGHGRFYLPGTELVGT